MDPVKVKGITEWPVPKDRCELQSFLGFTNFYRRFIRDYDEIAQPLTALTGKRDWQWKTEQQESFQRIKNLIASSAVLCLPTNDDQFRVKADASNCALGAVLSQFQGNKWHPVAFLSKAMNETERNYEYMTRRCLRL
jgi:hypothetical protein